MDAVRRPSAAVEAVPVEGAATIVRPAGPRDAFAIFDTLMNALASSDTPWPEPDMPYAIQALLDQIAQGLVFVAALDDAPERIVGVIVLDVTHWPWVSPRNLKGAYLYNQYFWVEPRHRRGGTAVRLLEAAKTRALSWKRADGEDGLPLFIETTSLDGGTGLKERFVESCGFVQVGAKMMMR